jgi:hypothetical protein
MALNTSLITGIQAPKFETQDPIAEYTKGMQLRHLMLQGDTQQQEAQDNDIYRKAMMQSGGDAAAGAKAAIASGLGLKSSGVLRKLIQDEALNAVNLKEKNSVAEKNNNDVMLKRLDFMGQGYGWLKDNPSIENANSLASHYENNGIWTREQAQKAMSQIQADPSPENVRRLATMGYQSTINAKDQMPKLDFTNQGGFFGAGATNPMTGVRTETGRVQNEQSPDNIANNARIASEGKLNRGQAESHFQATQAAGFAKPFEATGPDGKPVLIRQDKAGNIVPVEGYSPKTAAAKPMPSSAVKLQNSELESIGTFAGLDSDLAGLQKQMADGKLDFGPLKNLANTGKNYLGMSTEQSRNLATFKSKMENMRNAVLLLNKGVQTEGDANRAMNEIMANINDPDVVKQRLEEVRALNQRAVTLRKNNVDALRREYSAPDFDYSKFENQPRTTNLGASIPPDIANLLKKHGGK